MTALADGNLADSGDIAGLSALDRKVYAHLADRVVLKRLTRWNEAYKDFPRFVMEYLCARYIDPHNPARGQAIIDKLLKEHYVDSSEVQLIKSEIREKGAYALLGSLAVRLDERADEYWADVPAIASNKVRIAPAVLHEYRDVLLTTGAWGTMRIEWDRRKENDSAPFRVTQFTPFQVTRLSLDDYIERRALFSDDEWIDLLISSIGFEPSRLSQTEKWLYLLRLVPFVEKNYNMLELGPRETGKTFFFRNMSSRVAIVSGGAASQATLFYNAARNVTGIVGVAQVVYFDEIGNTKFQDPEVTISILQDYMSSGQYTRAGRPFTSTASIVMGGNIDCDMLNRRPASKYANLFEPLPEELGQRTAFLDRIHAYLPGWEMPKIVADNYAAGFGFMTDYLAAIFDRLRARNCQGIVEQRARLDGLKSRDLDAVKKTAAGLLKIVYPHRDAESASHPEIAACVDLAVRCRQRVVTELGKIAPAEFRGIVLDVPVD